MKYKLYIIIIVILIISAVALYRQTDKTRLITSTNNTKKSSINENESGTLFTIGTNQIIVNEGIIFINPGFDDAVGPKELQISATTYPELYSDSCSRIHIGDIDIGERTDKQLIYLACQGNNRGGLSDMYQITIDPDIPKIVDSGRISTSPVGGPVVYYNESCANCPLPIYEYKTYESKSQKFILTNNKHISQFKNLLKIYESKFNQDCYINEKRFTLGEALQSAKTEDKCSDLLMGPKDIRPAPDFFITIGELREIINNINRVINGENIQIYTFSVK